jgi:hypothetical protein
LNKQKITFLYFSKLEQSNYWKIFGLLEKGFNGPAHMHSAVWCCFDLAEHRASVWHPDRAHT